MEILKRQQIVNTAMEIFKEKGYVAASMKEIAEACGMAKGSIYKLFPSKEDLFTAVFEACHQIMFAKAKELDFGPCPDNDPKERLRRKIEFQLRYMLENYYFTSEFKELPVKDHEHFILAWKKKRMMLLNLHRDFFVEAYGEKIGKHIWDVVTIFRGMLREYLAYAKQKVVRQPLSELARFIQQRMDAIVRDMLEEDAVPVMDEHGVYVNELHPADPAALRENVQEFLDSLKDQLEELPMAEHQRKELQDVIRLLKQEFERPDPNPTLLHVYVSFLENNPAVGAYAKQLSFMF